MKKILSLLMVLTLSLVLFGCNNEEDKFWEDTHTYWTEYSAKQENLPYLSRNADIEYLQGTVDISSTLAAQIEYRKLIVNYETLVDATMEVVSNIANTLEVKPINTKKDVKKIYKNLETKLGELSSAISAFETVKVDFASRIDLENLETYHSLQLLREVKREFRNVLESANACKDAALQIYKKAIKDYPTSYVATISAGTYKFMKLEELGYLITAQINFLKEFEIDKENYNDTTILTKIEEVLNQYDSISADVDYETFNEEKEFVERLASETEFFLTALENVDVQDYYENSNYLEENPTHKGYITKIIYYLNI